MKNAGFCVFHFYIYIRFSRFKWNDTAIYTRKYIEALWFNKNLFFLIFFGAHFVTICVICACKLVSVLALFKYSVIHNSNFVHYLFCLCIITEKYLYIGYQKIAYIWRGFHDDIEILALWEWLLIIRWLGWTTNLYSICRWLFYNWWYKYN